MTEASNAEKSANEESALLAVPLQAPIEPSALIGELCLNTAAVYALLVDEASLLLGMIEAVDGIHLWHPVSIGSEPKHEDEIAPPDQNSDGEPLRSALRTSPTKTCRMVGQVIEEHELDRIRTAMKDSIFASGTTVASGDLAVATDRVHLIHHADELEQEL